MNGLIASIIVGVVVTVIGTVLAFYFGGVRERQKREYERQKQEREQLEERQKERKKKGTEAFGEIARRMNSIMDALTEYLRRAQMLPHRRPSGGTIDRLQWDWRAYDVWKPFLVELETLLTRSNAIDKDMASLRDYYHAHESSLEPTTRSLFASFDEEVIRRYQHEFEDSWLGEGEEEYKASLEWHIQHLEAHQRTRVPFLGRLKDMDIDEIYQKEWSGIAEIFAEGHQQLQRDWDFQAYRTALREEKAKYNG